MTPDERQLITGLFDRMKPVASQQRDRDAETLIGDQVRTQPYAPYLLAQTVIVQDQALRAANDRIQQLEEAVRQHEPTGAQAGGTSFLGGLGRSIFGSGQPDQGRQTVPPTNAQAVTQQSQDPYRNPGYGQGAPAGGPWGGQGAGAAPAGGGLFGGGGGGGGFMKGALGAAAGVAGGVLMADGIRNLFSGGHNPYGIASGMGDGGMGGFGNPGGETIVNNYYDNSGQGGTDYGSDQGGDSGFDGGGDYSSDV